MLLAWGQGDDAALERLVPLVHHELHRIARRCMTYLRLIDVQHVNWQDRAHFLAMSARLMRRILVDIARAKGYQKRGGDAVRVTFDELGTTGRCARP